jgi:hypothetical protein
MTVGGVSMGEMTSPVGYAFVFIGSAVQLVLILLTPVALFGIPLWLRRYEQNQTLAV